MYHGNQFGAICQCWSVHLKTSAFESFNEALSNRVQKSFDRSLHQKLNFMSGNRLASPFIVWPLHVVSKLLSTPRWLPLGCTRNKLFFVTAGRHESCHCVCNSCYQILFRFRQTISQVFMKFMSRCHWHVDDKFSDGIPEAYVRSIIGL